MKLSQSFWQTYKETPKDAEVPSHRLMMRAGLLHKTGSGIYHFLPFCLRVIQKLEGIIRQEMNRIGSMEVKMSMVTPSDLWEESGRWTAAQDVMLQFKDRNKKQMCISPTNEETITDVIRKSVKSYKQLPISLYQINTKFRDEIRPRFGLMRGREFLMKDAYTFHENQECLDIGYQKMYDAYEKVLKRIGLDYIVVEADAGMMASSQCKTHEFQVIADTGEDLVVYSNEANYAANIEKSVTIRKNLDFCAPCEREEVETIGMKTILDVCKYLNCPQHHSLKSLVFTALYGEEEKHFLIMLLGDDDVNEVKLSNFLECDQLYMAKIEALSKLELIKGYIGPYQLNNLHVVFDKNINLDASYVVGANKENIHLKGFVPNRDTENFKSADLRLSRVGDYTEDGKHEVFLKKGIEVGHIFQLGQKYTESLNAGVLDKNGKNLYPVMGCYGIGVSRLVAAAIEQAYDEKGIVWPKSIAPFHVYFAFIGKSEEIKNMANKLYDQLLDAGIEVLFDDRGVGPGMMFKDADLLGLPIRLTLGERDYKKDQTLEIVLRASGESVKVRECDVIETIQLELKKL